MKVRLLKEARVRHCAGEVVEVSSAEAVLLLAYGAAEEVKEKKTEAEGQKEAKPKKKKEA